MPIITVSFINAYKQKFVFRRNLAIKVVQLHCRIQDDMPRYVADVFIKLEFTVFMAMLNILLL